MEEGIIKKLVASVKCSVCGQDYGEDNISILGQREGLWFFKAVCPACHTKCLMTAVVKESREPEFVTSDLAEAELNRFKNMGRLTGDEMLDMHNFLKDFDGDFSQLFSQGRFGIVKD
ncbi:hypothetical protein ES703_121459 [subsurface metagenome]